MNRFLNFFKNYITYKIVLRECLNTSTNDFIIIQDRMMVGVLEVLKNIQQNQVRMMDALSKMTVEQHNICTSLMSLTNAYIEVHKGEHPSVENFHLSQS